MRVKYDFDLFLQYWHDPINLDEYVAKSQFLAEINNEREVKNASYAENLKKLENFVMAKFVEVNNLFREIFEKI